MQDKTEKKKRILDFDKNLKLGKALFAFSIWFYFLAMAIEKARPGTGLVAIILSFLLVIVSLGMEW